MDILIGLHLVGVWNTMVYAMAIVQSPKSILQRPKFAENIP